MHKFRLRVASTGVQSWVAVWCFCLLSHSGDALLILGLTLVFMSLVFKRGALCGRSVSPPVYSILVQPPDLHRKTSSTSRLMP